MRSAIRLMMTLGFAVTAVGCASFQTDELTIEESSRLVEKTVVLSQYQELPDFPAKTATNVQFGLMGHAAAVSNGNAMIADNAIQDPAREISRQLAQGLSRDFGLTVVESDKQLGDSRELDELAEIYPDHDYILDVKTLGWNSFYFKSDWNNYRVSYVAHARLINTDSQAVVAEEVCSFAPDFEDTDDAPSYDELENGEGLRRELDKAVTYCVDYIATMAKLHHQKKVQDMAVTE